MSKDKPSTASEILTQATIYAASITLGLVSMWTSIRSHFNKKMKDSTQWFDAIRAKRCADIESIAHLSGPEHMERHLEIHKEYSKSLRKILEDKGYGGSVSKFKFLTKHQKVQVIGIALTVATVAVGAITNIRQSKQNEVLIRKLEAMERERDAQKASPGVG